MCLLAWTPRSLSVVCTSPPLPPCGTPHGAADALQKAVSLRQGKPVRWDRGNEPRCRAGRHVALPLSQHSHARQCGARWGEALHLVTAIPRGCNPGLLSPQQWVASPSQRPCCATAWAEEVASGLVRGYGHREAELSKARRHSVVPADPSTCRGGSWLYSLPSHSPASPRDKWPGMDPGTFLGQSSAGHLVLAWLNRHGLRKLRGSCACCYRDCLGLRLLHSASLPSIHAMQDRTCLICVHVACVHMHTWKIVQNLAGWSRKLASDEQYPCKALSVKMQICPKSLKTAHNYINVRGWGRADIGRREWKVAEDSCSYLCKQHYGIFND